MTLELAWTLFPLFVVLVLAVGVICLVPILSKIGKSELEEEMLLHYLDFSADDSNISARHHSTLDYFREIIREGNSLNATQLQAIRHIKKQYF